MTLVGKKHLIIVPFFNEEKFLERFLDSIIHQSMIPTKLILVDDGSTDDSPRIAIHYANSFKWIEYYKHTSDNRKEQGTKVIRAFNFGLNKVNWEDYEFISKFDADLEFPSNYLNEILQAFNDSTVGLVGGRIAELKKKNWVVIPQASYHIRGALKTYRMKCFQEIDGLIPVLGWDGLDEMKAFYFGWESRIIDVKVKHFRPASSDYDPVKLSKKKGIAAYTNGASFFMTFLRMIFKLKSKPRFKVGLSFMEGYLEARRKKMPKNVDDDLAKFINKFHFKRILSFK